MRQVFLATLMLALAGLASGCKLGHGLHGCADGACGHGGCGPGGCPDGACGPDGHASPYEPFHGHAPVQRGGLIDHIHASSMAGPGIGPGGLGGGLGAGMGGGIGPGGMGGGGGLQPTPPASAGAVSYPYYTTRGPRDFLAPNPRGIGP